MVGPAGYRLHPHAALLFDLERTMLPKLTPFLDNNRFKYRVPDVWKKLSWAKDFDNYPDQEHLLFEEEYDWEYRNERGVVYGYINHVEGSERLEKIGRKVNRKTMPKPFTYYAFAQGAVHLHNNPDLIRDVRAKKGLHGSFVVNYVNSIPVDELFDRRFNDELDEQLVEKLKAKTHIIPVTYGALLARVYNETSGVHEGDKLSIEPREGKIMVCPNPDCACAFELLSRDFWTSDHPDYDEKVAKSGNQYSYRKHRDIHGDRPDLPPS